MVCFFPWVSMSLGGVFHGFPCVFLGVFHGFLGSSVCFPRVFLGGFFGFSRDFLGLVPSHLFSQNQPLLGNKSIPND